MNTALTIDTLVAILKEKQYKGLGKKKVLISTDDEGNGYHELFFGVTENAKDFFAGPCAPYLPYGVTMENIDNYVILG